MKEVLQHLLGPFQWSLANLVGYTEKTNKAALSHNLEARKTSMNTLTYLQLRSSMTWGFYTRCKETATFSELLKHVYRTVLLTSTPSTRVDIVFDRYNAESIKTPERRAIGEDSGISFSKIIPGHECLNWRPLVACSESKGKLTNFFTTNWQEKQARRDQIQERWFL